MSSQIWPDDEMPFLTTETYTDEHGVVHPKGVRERVDLITNPLATPNRTIPMAMIEGSVTFILDRTRKHAATLPFEEARDFIFDIIRILNPKQEEELRNIYDDLDEKGKKQFIEDCISLNKDGTLDTKNGIYIRWEAFSEGSSMRDQIIEVYQKYPDVFKPYHVFVPKPKWGKELYIGDNPVGYQYILTLKQSSTSQFSVRPSGSIGDEGMPEKSRTNKTSKAPWSQKPIRFGEYETLNFFVATRPDDMALITSLYRSSVDGRRWMFEAILSDDAKYNLPDHFTSRSAEVAQVYFKSLGVRMDTVIDDEEYIGFFEDKHTMITYQVHQTTLFITVEQRRLLKKVQKAYRKYLKKYPNTIDTFDHIWSWIMDHITMHNKKKLLNGDIKDIFRENLTEFTQDCKEKVI